MVSSGTIGTDRNWQPDHRATLSLTLLFALCALYGFVWLLRQPAVLPDRHPDAVSILLHPAVTARPASRLPTSVPRRERRPRNTKPAIHPSRPVVLPEQPSPLNLRAPAQVLQAPVFMEPQAKTSDRNLQRLLNAPRKPAPDLENGSSYRNNAGETVIKAGGLCGRAHTMQMSPSPTNRATVGFLTDCPGEYQPTLGEQLLEWANRKAEKSAKPPA